MKRTSVGVRDVIYVLIELVARYSEGEFDKSISGAEG